MSPTSVTLRTRKFMTNRLLARRQFVSAQSRPRCGPMAGVFPVAGVGGGVLGDRALTGAHAFDSDANSSTRFSLPSSQILDVLHPAAPTCPRYDHATQLIF